jgi:hypothetical protein
VAVHSSGNSVLVDIRGSWWSWLVSGAIIGLSIIITGHVLKDRVPKEGLPFRAGEGIKGIRRTGYGGKPVIIHSMELRRDGT